MNRLAFGIVLMLGALAVLWSFMRWWEQLEPTEELIYAGALPIAWLACGVLAIVGLAFAIGDRLGRDR